MITELCGVQLKNPVIMASGTFGFGAEYSAFYDVSKLGGICSKGLTLERRDGNSGQRVFETPSGMMNSVGLQNPGVDAFISEELPKMRKLGTVIIANVGGSRIEDYLQSIEKLNSTGVDIVELNISCPNVKQGGMSFGIKADIAGEFVKEARAVCKKPLLVKLSPNAEDICRMALACQKSGADGLTLVNTFKGMAIDIQKRKPVFENVFAGLSGPAIKPVALRMVYEVCKCVEIPVVGLGGISTASDAIEFIMSGAAAIQVGTASFANPTAGLDIVNGIEDFMKRNGIKALHEIRGIV